MENCLFDILQMTKKKKYSKGHFPFSSLQFPPVLVQLTDFELSDEYTLALLAGGKVSSQCESARQASM